MITREQYLNRKLGHPEVTEQVEENLTDLLSKVNALLGAAEHGCGYDWAVDPDTGSCISGAKGGSGDGGFRLSDSKTGAPNSAHKTGDAVDVYDSGNKLDSWLTDQLLEDYGLYREIPTATNGWCHLQRRPPGSRRRTFSP